MNTDIWNTLIKYRLSPNQLYLIHCIHENIVPAEIINAKAEANVCKQRGWITEDNQLTDAAKGVLVEINNNIGKAKRKTQKVLLGDEHIPYIEMYRELWPKGNLPSGKPARLSMPDTKKKFLEFFKEHDYTWEIIIKATKEYLRKYEHDKMYMMTSGYFIMKNAQSELASYCEMVSDPDYKRGDEHLYYSHVTAV